MLVEMVHGTAQQVMLEEVARHLGPGAMSAPKTA